MVRPVRLRDGPIVVFKTRVVPLLLNLCKAKKDKKKMSSKGTTLGPYGPYNYYSVLLAYGLGLGPVVILRETPITQPIYSLGRK